MNSCISRKNALGLASLGLLAAAGGASTSAVAAEGVGGGGSSNVLVWARA